MKKLVLSLIMFASLQVANAQIEVPKASPVAEVEQIVGLTKVEVDYARPSKKGRSVFGDLVPYGRLWRTGANENTKIEFSDDVYINGILLPKGEYAIYTIPNPTEWKVIFYKETNNWGLPKEFNENSVALTTVVPVKDLSKEIEYFKIEINPLSNNKGELVFGWERTSVAVEFEVPTHAKTLASLSNLNESSKAGDYYSAGQYLFTSNTDLKKGLEYVNKAISMSGDAPFYMLRGKSLIQAALGDKKGAIQTAKQSLEKSEKANNADYIKMNKDSILEWSK